MVIDRSKGNDGTMLKTIHVSVLLDITEAKVGELRKQGWFPKEGDIPLADVRKYVKAQAAGEVKVAKKGRTADGRKFYYARLSPEEAEELRARGLVIRDLNQEYLENKAARTKAAAGALERAGIDVASLLEDTEFTLSELGE